jgi:predicted nuclease with TOPRIM domain
MDQETVAEIKRHFDLVAEGLQGEIQGLQGEIQGLRGEFQGLQGEFQGLQGEFQGLQGEFQGLRGEMQGLQGDMQGLRGEIRLVDEKGERRSDDLERRLLEEIQTVRRHFDVVGESLRSDIRLVAEGVTGLDEKFTLEFRSVREEMGEQIGEVKSLIRASYGDLDRRVQALERKPS